MWAYRNNTTWGQLNPNNVTALTVGDLDNNGQAEVVASFATYGIWIYRNNTSWNFLHPYVASVLAHGRLDGGTQADLVIDFGPVHGVWLYKNSSAWSQLHRTPVKVWSSPTLTVTHGMTSSSASVQRDCGETTTACGRSCTRMRSMP